MKIKEKLTKKEKEEKRKLKENPYLQTIIYLVENEGMTANGIGIERKSEIPLSIGTIRKTIKLCEKYGYIDKVKHEKSRKERRVPKKGKYRIVKNGEEIPVMYKKNEEISLSELRSLEGEIIKANSDNTNIIEIANKYISEEEYEKALKLIRARHQSKNITVSKDMEGRLKLLESSLVRACKIQTASRMLCAGNNNIIAISELTGVSKEILAILKMKLREEKVKFISLNAREKAVSEFLKYKSTYEIQQQFGINDAELVDIEEQAKYRQLWKKGKRNFEVKVKQDSRTRIIVLATKLGIKKAAIAKALKLNLDEVETYRKIALKVDLIKENELKGINLLDYGISSKREITR